MKKPLRVDRMPHLEQKERLLVDEERHSQRRMTLLEKRTPLVVK
jgi:hypothetical protein